MPIRRLALSALTMLAVTGVALFATPSRGQADDAAPAAAAAPAPAAAPPAPAWGSSCQSASRAGPLDCRIEQRAVLAGSGQLVAAVTIRVPGDTRAPLLMIRLPLGLSLAGGVTVAVDGASGRELPLQTCDGSGCYAGTPLPDDLRTALQRGKTFDLVFTGLDRRPVKVSLPLQGFAAAYAAIK